MILETNGTSRMNLLLWEILSLERKNLKVVIEWVPEDKQCETVISFSFSNDMVIMQHVGNKLTRYSLFEINCYYEYKKGLVSLLNNKGLWIFLKYPCNKKSKVDRIVGQIRK